jgi:hypothetical protein
MKRKKQCACGVWFTPYARAWKTQTTCSKDCRARRVQELCSRWRKRTPAYFKGRYPNTKRWLAKHPNYLRRYRANHPDYVEADNKNRRERRLRRQDLRADIQNGLLRREITAIRTIRGADIQNTLRLHLDGLFDVLAGSPRADIQNKSVPSPAP